MAGFSKHLAQAIFNMTLNPSSSSYTPPVAIYLGLHTAQPDDVTYGNEATYGNYARALIQNMTSTIVAGATATDWILRARNATAITFNISDGPNEIITHWAVWDSPNKGTGNILYSGAAGSSRIISAGDALVVSDNQLVIDIT